MARELVHGTCVALGDRGILLRGPSGAGKSDLALRFLANPGDGALRPRLVSDDQVLVTGADGVVTASAPKTLAGLIEVRGVGITEMPFVASTTLALICDLVASDAVPRMPPNPSDKAALLGVTLPAIRLAAFEASAPLKLKMALLQAVNKG